MKRQQPEMGRTRVRRIFSIVMLLAIGWSVAAAGTTYADRNKVDLVGTAYQVSVFTDQTDTPVYAILDIFDGADPSAPVILPATCGDLSFCAAYRNLLGNCGVHPVTGPDPNNPNNIVTTYRCDTGTYGLCFHYIGSIRNEGVYGFLPRLVITAYAGTCAPVVNVPF